MANSRRTLRITGLPNDANPDRVKQYLLDRIRPMNENDLHVHGVYLHDYSTSGATCCAAITFRSYEHYHRAIKLEAPSRRFGSRTTQIDEHFKDLTTLYSSNNPKTGKPDVE